MAATHDATAYLGQALTNRTTVRTDNVPEQTPVPHPTTREQALRGRNGRIGDGELARLQPEALTPRSRLARGLLIAAGVALLVVAAIGAVVPVIPTTPFLLLAAACFVRSSPRLHRWMFTNRVFGEYLAAYRAGRGLPMASKVATLALLWVSIGASAVFGIPSSLWWLKVVLLLVAVGVTIHVARLRTHRRS